MVTHRTQSFIYYMPVEVCGCDCSLNKDGCDWNDAASGSTLVRGSVATDGDPKIAHLIQIARCTPYADFCGDGIQARLLSLMASGQTASSASWRLMLFMQP